MPDTNTLPEQLLSQAIAQGADAAEVFQSGSLSRPVIFEGNRLKQVETSQSEGVALRLWKNGQPGVAVGHGPIEPQALVDKALAISALNAPETPYLSEGTAEGRQRNLADVGQAVAVEQLVDWGRGAIAKIRDQFPEVVCEAELSCDVETTRLVNSKGLDYRHQDTCLSGYLNAELVDQDDFLYVGDGLTQRNHLDMPAVADTIIQRLRWANRTVELDAGENNSVPIIFTPGAAWLLWGTLRSALNGKRVSEGTSPWSQKWGDTVVAEAITLRQDPKIGPYSCPFDDEGMLTQPLMLVENGRIKNWYCDQTIGQMTGKPVTGKPDAVPQGLGNGSTGNGLRPDLGSYPTPGLINLLVAPGSLDWDALIAEVPEAIIVDQVMGEGGDITGDMSVNLELGYRVSQGEIIGRVKDTMVSGNAYTALKSLIALGNDAQWCGSTYTPSVVVGSLSVTG
ncbi:MAG: TldD/PmbA family protein [Cyanobacteria bacterium P01_F01_bin.53]